MRVLIALPILTGLVILQSTIISRLPLLHGTADLVLLVILAWALQKRVQTAWQWGIIGGLLVTIVSAAPLGVWLAAYSLAVGVALLLRQRVWQVPMLAMFIATFAGTVITQGISIGVLRLSGSAIALSEAVNLITLPSLLLNLLLAIPAYGLLGDLASWLYPEELEV